MENIKNKKIKNENKSEIQREDDLTVLQGKEFRAIRPDEYSIEVKKLGDGLYSFRYVERLSKPENYDDSVFMKAVERTKRIAYSVFGGRDDIVVKVESVSDGSVEFVLETKTTFDEIATAIVSEFTTVSSLSDMTIRDALMYMGIGRAMVTKIRLMESNEQTIVPGVIGELEGYSEGIDGDDIHDES